MRQYNLINRCLSTLKSSRIDVMTKLRMENLLSGLKMLLLMDAEQETMPDLEELFSHVNQFCTGESADGVKGLVDHVRRLHVSMARA
jgi:hypothetical protein